MSSLKKRRQGRRAEPPRRAVTVLLACNDPDNGNFEGMCRAVEFPGDFLELTSYDNGRILRFGDDCFFLSGKRWPIVGYKSCYGNWCWDAVRLEIPVAADFLTWLRRRDLFDVDSGWCEIFEWFKGERPAPPRDALESKLRELAREQRP